MATPSSVLEADVVVSSDGDSHRLIVARLGACSFVSKMRGAVRMLIMYLFWSLIASCVVFGVNCAWVFLSLVRARCLRRMALFRSVRISLLTVLARTCFRIF
jgi:hypothetical protein